MFDFSDTNTGEYQNFLRYVNQETNKPYGIEYLRENLTSFEYNYIPKLDKSLLNTHEQEGFISAEECSELVAAAEKRNGWLASGSTLQFWEERNIPLFNVVPALSSDDKIKKLLVRIHDGLRDAFSKRFNNGLPVYCDQIGIVRWPVGSWQMTHIDHVDGLDRVCGSVVYLNDDYEGGETFYPFFEKSMKPLKGKMFAHSPDNEHLHGVTKIIGKTRYTISSTWGTNENIQPYKQIIEAFRQGD